MVAHNPGEGNLHFVQKSFEGGFEFDVLFSSDSISEAMTSSSLTEGIQDALSTFSKRFQSVYSPQEPFQDEQHMKFSQSLLSNLMGGKLDTFTEQAKLTFLLRQNMPSLARTSGEKPLWPNLVLLLKNRALTSFSVQYPPGLSSLEAFSGTKASISKLS